MIRFNDTVNRAITLIILLNVRRDLGTKGFQHILLAEVQSHIAVCVIPHPDKKTSTTLCSIYYSA